LLTEGRLLHNSTPAANGPSPEDLRRRVDELERELERVRSERDEYRSAVYALADELAPPDPNWQPPSPEETVGARDLLARLRGKYAGEPR
jgi:hypothetical protein